jgi:hypothetical protein
MDMSRDIQDRLERFIGESLIFKRLGLNRGQIDQCAPPPNPAKITDSRFHDYLAQHGRDSWELDALNPQLISALIEQAIFAYRNVNKWAKVLKEEQRHKTILHWAATNWPEVEQLNQRHTKARGRSRKDVRHD